MHTYLRMYTQNYYYFVSTSHSRGILHQVSADAVDTSSLNILDNVNDVESKLGSLMRRIRSCYRADLPEEGSSEELNLVEWHGSTTPLGTQMLAILQHCSLFRLCLKESNDVLREQRSVCKMLSKMLQKEQTQSFRLQSFLLHLSRSRPELLDEIVPLSTFVESEKVDPK